jgi:hypothetical protein
MSDNRFGIGGNEPRPLYTRDRIVHRLYGRGVIASIDRTPMRARCKVRIDGETADRGVWLDDLVHEPVDMKEGAQ